MKILISFFDQKNRAAWSLVPASLFLAILLKPSASTALGLGASRLLYATLALSVLLGIWAFFRDKQLLLLNSLLAAAAASVSLGELEHSTSRKGLAPSSKSSESFEVLHLQQEAKSLAGFDLASYIAQQRPTVFSLQYEYGQGNWPEDSAALANYYPYIRSIQCNKRLRFAFASIYPLSQMSYVEEDMYRGLFLSLWFEPLAQDLQLGSIRLSPQIPAQEAIDLAEQFHCAHALVLFSQEYRGMRKLGQPVSLCSSDLKEQQLEEHRGIQSSLFHSSQVHCVQSSTIFSGRGIFAQYRLLPQEQSGQVLQTSSTD